MYKEVEKHPKIHHSTRLGVLKIRSDAKDFGLSPKAGEKDVALRVGENSA